MTDKFLDAEEMVCQANTDLLLSGDYILMVGVDRQ